MSLMISRRKTLQQGSRVQRLGLTLTRKRAGTFRVSNSRLLVGTLAQCTHANLEELRDWHFSQSGDFFMRTFRISLLLTLFLLSGDGDLSAANEDSLVVETEHGRVRGKRVGKADAFLGIPYARPPLGDLRWRPPVPPARWADVRDARSYATAAAQRIPNPSGIREASEDCLYLNVIAPVQRSTDHPLPVMMYLHGGSNVQGSPTRFTAGVEDLMVGQRNNIVLVTVQFRLGSLGFLPHPALTAESEHGSSGNYGFLDQIAALRWIHRNIRQFGGDPTRVTVFGGSSGSIDTGERSCTAEFSGFLLYKELGRKLKGKSPVLAECFSLMSRDEARHAGFLNKAMSDFNLSLDLGFLTKNRKYTFFKPKFIFYATYLSEKIGYWRYITIYRHLEKNPEDCIYPIFKFFENWCQDENRHGDFFDAIMRAQPDTLNDWRARLWCRFFLLSVFATMYLNDIQRSSFYASIGLDAREYDKYVIEKTNETAGRVFPIILDVENPRFYQSLEFCIQNNDRLREIASSNQSSLVKLLKKIPYYVSNAWQLIQLYFLNPIPVDQLEGTVR